MKAIILAGGAGTRLYPMTKIFSKQLQPIYDKPMIYYPVSLLMLAGIKDILIISTERDTPLIENLLGDGSSYGISISYVVQAEPKGLPEAFVLGETFIDGDDVTLILGDNLFYGDLNFLRRAIEDQKKSDRKYSARIFGYKVDDARRYGVVEFDKETREVISIEEKPDNPKSNYAIPGLYIFDGNVATHAKSLKPSSRGETEITDLMKKYHEQHQLRTELIGRGVSWLDTGTPQSLLEAASLIAAVQTSQGLIIGCLEEIAYRRGFLSKSELIEITEKLPRSPYRQYLERIIHDEVD